MGGQGAPRKQSTAGKENTGNSGRRLYRTSGLTAAHCRGAGGQRETWPSQWELKAEGD